MKWNLLRSKICVACGIWLFTFSVHGQVLLNPAFNYQEKQSKEGSTGTSKDVQQIYNVSLGYLLPSRIFIGAKYFNATFSTESMTTTSPTVTTTTIARTKESAYGLSLGYLFDKGLALGFSYLPFDAQEKGPGYRYYGGHAEIFDLGYQFKIGGIGIGPQLTLSKFYHKKKEENGVKEDLPGAWYTQRVLPYVSLWLLF